MTFMLGDFVEKLRPIGRLDLLDDVGTKALGYLERAESAGGNLPSLVNRVKALRIIGEVNSKRGRSIEASKALTTGTELVFNAPPSYRNSPDFIREAAKILSAIGQVHSKNNEPDKAARYFNEYLKFGQLLLSVSTDPIEGWLELSYAHAALGSLAMSRSDFAQAADQFSKSLELKKRALEKRPEDKVIIAELAGSVSWRAESLLKLGNPPAAMELYRQEEALLRSVYTENATWASLLSVSLMRQALLHTAFGDRSEAARALLNAEEILQNLVQKDPTNVLWQSWLLQAQGRLVEAQLTKDNAVAMHQRLLSILEKFKELAAKEPKNTFLAYQTVKFELGRTYILQMMGRDKDALLNVEAVQLKLETLHSQAQRDSILLAFLSESILARADLARQLGDNSVALPLCKKVSNLLADAPNAENNFALLSFQVRAELCQGTTAAINPKLTRLRAMGFREARFTQYMSTHPLMKGKL